MDFVISERSEEWGIVILSEAKNLFVSDSSAAPQNDRYAIILSLLRYVDTKLWGIVILSKAKNLSALDSSAAPQNDRCAVITDVGQRALLSRVEPYPRN